LSKRNKEREGGEKEKERERERGREKEVPQHAGGSRVFCDLHSGEFKY